MADTPRTDHSDDVIDFTVMYATHDAFRRDLERLWAASVGGRARTPEVLAGWENFKHQLHIHHTVEDSDLWPRVAQAVAGRPDELALLAAMEAEHAALDPVLTEVDEALAAGPATAQDVNLTELIQRLSTVLGDHLKHEEEDGLPLIQSALTRADWQAFAGGMRRAQGIRGAMVYVPWIVDGIPALDRKSFLDVMPPPVRVLNGLFWESRYRRRHLWNGND